MNDLLLTRRKPTARQPAALRAGSSCPRSSVHHVLSEPGSNAGESQRLPGSHRPPGNGPTSRRSHGRLTTASIGNEARSTGIAAPRGRFDLIPSCNTVVDDSFIFNGVYMIALRWVLGGHLWRYTMWRVRRGSSRQVPSRAAERRKPLCPDPCRRFLHCGQPKSHV